MEARDYAGPDDLRRMQRLVAELWRLEGPLVATRVGDLPWRMYQHLDKLSQVDVRLWLEGDECVAERLLEHRWERDAEPGSYEQLAASAPPARGAPWSTPPPASPPRRSTSRSASAVSRAT